MYTISASDIINHSKVIDETIAKFGKLDVLYINHGIMPVGPVFTNSIELIEKVITVNFMSFLYLTKFALPHMRASKGMIGLTSSMAGASLSSHFRLVLTSFQ